jgi:hypothetical protein
MLGFTDEEINGGIDWNHNPPLALRFVDPDTGEISPAANDPKYIEPLRRKDHHKRTFGTPATTAGSDIHAIAKAKRLAKEQEEARRRMLAKSDGSQEIKPRKKTKWASRPFPKRKKETSPDGNDHSEDLS